MAILSLGYEQPVAILLHILRRIVARIIDLLILGLLGWGVLEVLPIELLGDNGWIAGLLLITLYEFLSYGRIGKGATVGKWLLRLRVVSREGDLLNPLHAMIRALTFAISLSAASIGEAAMGYLPVSWGHAAYTASIVILITAGFVTVLQLLSNAQRRSYFDLLSGSICLGKRELNLLGLPRAGIELFPTNPYQSNPERKDVFRAGEAVVSSLWWVLPLLVFLIAMVKTDPVVGSKGDLQSYMRTVANAKGLPLSGIAVYRSSDLPFRFDNDYPPATLVIRARPQVIVQESMRDPLRPLAFALWQLAVPAIPPYVAPEQINITLETGGTLGFTSLTESYQQSFTPKVVDDSTATLKPVEQP